MLDRLGTFKAQTQVLFGRGAVAALGEIVRDMGGRRYLLVADPGLEDHGVIEAVQNHLGLDTEGEVFTGVEPEPYLDNAEDACARGRQAEVDVVIGLGGGSAMDTAKAAAALIANEGRADQYVGLNLLPAPGLPTIMIPTTAGTGSEVTFTAVFTNRETNAKGGINSEFMFPDMALLDPELTVTLPPDVTAATGMDALTHAVESVTSRSASVFTEALALAAVRLICENLRRAVYAGGDIGARENMLYGSLLAGMALADAGVGAAHALAYPLGGLYRIGHGLANAMLIPHVMDFNVPAAEKTFCLIADSMGEPVEGLPPHRAAWLAVEAVAKLREDIGIPPSLHDLGIPKSDIPTLVKGALKVARPVENNPRTLGPEEATQIYLRAFDAT